MIGQKRPPDDLEKIKTKKKKTSFIQISQYANFEKEIISLCEKYPNGLNENILSHELNHIDIEVRIKIINSLVKRGRIQLYQQEGILVYKLIRKEDALKFRGLGLEELLVFQTIKETGNQGIWSRTLSKKTKVGSQLQNILKKLIARRMIKEVVNASERKRMHYMLYELEPADKLKPKALYQEGKPDRVAIDIVEKFILNCLKQKTRNGKAQLSAEYICQRIRESGVLKVLLSPKDVDEVAQSMVYDGIVEECTQTIEYEDIKRPTLYQFVTGADNYPPPMHGPNIPCLSCPISFECSPEGVICPKHCIYLTTWLGTSNNNCKS